MNNDRIKISQEIVTIGIKELAKIIHYKESTIKKLLSENPERLPPRLQSITKPTWYPPVIHQWLINDSTNNLKKRKTKNGRPRLTS